MTAHTTEEISEYLAAARLGLEKRDLSLNVGLAHMGKNEQNNAIRALQTAVLLGQHHPEAHFNLAIASENSNKLGEALVEIDTALNRRRTIAMHGI